MATIRSEVELQIERMQRASIAGRIQRAKDPYCTKEDWVKSALMWASKMDNEGVDYGL